MIYTKTAVNGIQKETPLSEVPMFCKCPGCGKEVEMPAYELMELVQDLDFDIDDSATYCENCQEAMNLSREHIRIMVSAVDNMPMNKLKQVYDLLLPYHTGETDD